MDVNILCLPRDIVIYELYKYLSDREKVLLSRTCSQFNNYLRYYSNHQIINFANLNKKRKQTFNYWDVLQKDSALFLYKYRREDVLAVNVVDLLIDNFYNNPDNFLIILKFIYPRITQQIRNMKYDLYKIAKDIIFFSIQHDMFDICVLVHDMFNCKIYYFDLHLAKNINHIDINLTDINKTLVYTICRNFCFFLDNDY